MTGRHVAALAVGLLLLLTGCAGSGGQAARQRADRLAREAGFHRTVVAAGPFHLAAFLRLSAPAKVLRVYIAGDGHAWETRTIPSDDPTPWSPVALELAVRDPAPAVAVLARPCQYVPLHGDPACNQAVWTGARYNPAVIASTNAALDRLEALAGASRLDLVGYSGGGAVAVLAAAHRTDVRSLRTVAANLDTALWTREHAVSPLTNSLNPVSVAPLLATVPQLHFVGSRDRVVDVSVVRSYADAAGPAACLRVVVVPGMRHGTDWAAVWPGLLATALPKRCHRPRTGMVTR